jgi:hypothetical protein
MTAHDQRRRCDALVRRLIRVHDSLPLRPFKHQPAKPFQRLRFPTNQSNCADDNQGHRLLTRPQRDRRLNPLLPTVVGA